MGGLPEQRRPGPLASQLRSLAHFSLLDTPGLPRRGQSAGRQQPRVCLRMLAELSVCGSRRHGASTWWLDRRMGPPLPPRLRLRAASGRSPGQLGFVPTIYSRAQTRTAAISVFLLLLRQGEGKESSPSKNITGKNITALSRTRDLSPSLASAPAPLLTSLLP